MSTPITSPNITAPPQRIAFRPERIMFSSASYGQPAADWGINDIRIGNRMRRGVDRRNREPIRTPIGQASGIIDHFITPEVP